MSSSAGRRQLIEDALSLAGRSSELLGPSRQWLNYGLRYVGLTFRFPELRKIGDPIALAQGASTADLPEDFGAGMEKMGMIFGSDARPLAEYSMEDFIANGGFPSSTSGNGRPGFYIIDRNAGNFRFSKPADQAYTFTPIYFIEPTVPDLDPSADSDPVWLDNDLIVVNLMMWMIYIFTEDAREERQRAVVESMLNQWKRETVKMGGTSRIQLSPNKFRLPGRFIP